MTLMISNVLHVNLDDPKECLSDQEICILVWDVLHQDFFGTTYSGPLFTSGGIHAQVIDLYLANPHVNEIQPGFTNFYRGYFNCECEQLILPAHISAMETFSALSNL